MNFNYWDQYYSERKAPVLPSQFAVFTLGEYRPKSVIDIGCGSGRDSFWFAEQGIPTVGVDGSQAAVDMCIERANGISHLQFIQASISDASLSSMLIDLVPDETLVYARFFLHAITEEDEKIFLGHAADIVKAKGGVLAIEYRTIRDKALAKETAEHFRRFIEPADLIAKAAQRGLSCRYAVEGFGFAKYKADDAYVSRMIFDSVL